MNIAVIPARGGSKRIPRKNIKVFNGKPMIAWSIDAALNSEIFDKVIVSTDDEEIATIAKSYGALVPFLRSAELSDDHAGTTEVISHATRFAVDQNWKIDAVCCIYATAPFVRVNDLRLSLDKLNSGDWEFCFTATEYAAPIFRSFKIQDAGGVEMFFPEHFTTRSQDLPEAFHDAGQFYWGRPQAWLQQKRIFDRHSIPFLIPRWRVQDIDTQADWDRAEILAPIIADRN